jgi:hypothetical protein
MNIKNIKKKEGEKSMQTIEREYTIKAINKGIENGNVRFDHPMQRKPGQWDLDQQSLLIHSVLAGFAVPQAYVLQIFEGDYDSYSVLDGKQRFTTLYDYMHDCFKLSANTPSVNIRRRRIIDGEDGQRKQENIVVEYELAGKLFSELNENLKEKMEEKVLSCVMLVDCTDEEIEEQFYRLNNGTPLTKDQKTRVLLGDDLSEFVDKVEATEFFDAKENKSYFTSLQRKRGEIQTCILQTLMLVMDYPFKNFNNDATMEFAKWFRGNHKISDLEYCEELFVKLNMAIPKGDKPHKLMKKTNIPILAYHIQTIDEMGVSLEKYGEWIIKFLNSYTPDCEYASYCGQGATSKTKVMARLEYVEKQLNQLEE